MVHVPAVESSDYQRAVATHGDALLEGCRCARCESGRLALTGTWVTRGFVDRSGRYERIYVVLARCLACRARERVLPCDALPGKVHSAGLAFDAVASATSPTSSRSRRSGCG